MARSDFFRGLPAGCGARIEPLSLRQYQLREAGKTLQQSSGYPDADTLLAAIMAGDCPPDPGYEYYLAQAIVARELAHTRQALQRAIAGQDDTEDSPQQALQIAITTRHGALYPTQLLHHDALLLTGVDGAQLLLRLLSPCQWRLVWQMTDGIWALDTLHGATAPRLSRPDGSQLRLVTPAPAQLPALLDWLLTDGAPIRLAAGV